MAGQNHKGNCLHCETKCTECKSQHHRKPETQRYSETVTIPRSVIEKVINISGDDVRRLLGAWL